MTTSPTRTEVLEALEWIENSYAPALTAFAPNHILTMVEAARAYARLAPDTCPTCKGSGKYVVQSTRGYLETDTLPCKPCGGRGYVWPVRLLEKVDKLVNDLELAHKVLDVLWEVGND